MAALALVTRPGLAILLVAHGVIEEVRRLYPLRAQTRGSGGGSVRGEEGEGLFGGCGCVRGVGLKLAPGGAEQGGAGCGRAPTGASGR